MLPENDLALELYHKIQALGAETVFKFMDLTIDQEEAGELLGKMALIAGIINEWQAQQKED